MKNTFIKTWTQNYNLKNYSSDFTVHKVKNLCILIDNNYPKNKIKNLAKKVANYINNNYYKKTIIIFCPNQTLINEFLLLLNKYTLKLKNKFIIINTRSSLYAQSSKIKERHFKNILVILPSYNKKLFEKYAEKLNIKYIDIIILNTNFITNTYKSYKNYKLITKIDTVK